MLIRKARSLRRPHLLPNWLYGVARRTALESKKRLARRHEREREMVDTAGSDDCAAAVWADLRPVLDEEIERLPTRYRVPFILCYLEGYTNEKAAEIIGCPKGTVLSRLAWARERLRQRLTRRGLAPPATRLGIARRLTSVKRHRQSDGADGLGAFHHRGGADVRGRFLQSWFPCRYFSCQRSINQHVLDKNYQRDGGFDGSGTGRWGRGSGLVGVWTPLGGGKEWRGNGRESVRAQREPADNKKDNKPATPVPAQQPADKKQEDKADTNAVVIGQVIEREVIDIEFFSGHTENVTSSQVGSGVTGRLDKIHVKNGDEIKKGVILFELDSRTQRAELDKAEAVLAQFEARFNKARCGLQAGVTPSKTTNA